MISTPIFIVVDLFCGFGGTTTGFASATIDGSNIAKVIACINHDAKAIKSHWLNHKDVKHFNEDIKTLDLTELKETVDYWQLMYPNAYLILWASLECTNFSKAKGGQPRNADSRTLAEHLFRYQEAINPDYIQIENVVEFMSWGPLDNNGKPISRCNGLDFVKWKKRMCSYGYIDDWKQLNSADFGAYTSRNRLFGCFAKIGLPIVWPEATYSKKPINSLFSTIKKWKPVKDVLNFEDEGDSIFSRKKPLSENTLKRIYAGLIKFIAKGNKDFIVQANSGNENSKVIDTNRPARTITVTGGNQSLVQTKFLLKYNSINGKTGVHHPPSVDAPCPTISCQGRLGIIAPKFISYYYGSNNQNSSVENPANTLTTKDRCSLIQPEYFINRDFKNATNSSIDDPAGTITTVPKMNLIECKYFLLNPQFSNTGNSIDQPCFTLIAKMDKRPPYLIQSKSGAPAIEVYYTDSEMAVKLKEFMGVYGLIDIRMRMLRVSELLKIQGFSKDYEMVGNQSDQKKFIGNSVVPIVVQRWAEAMAHNLIKNVNYIKVG